VLACGPVTASSLRIVRAPLGLVWRAFDADDVAGSVTAFLRPDDRWFVIVDPISRRDSYEPLLAAVAEDTAGDLYAAVEDIDLEALGIFARLGFTVNRRQSNCVVPTDRRSPG
jgi:hypothetical protein